MSVADGEGSGEGALDSVRQVERTLEDRQEIEKVAEARLTDAREERERILNDAREEGEKDAAERRREVLADADAEARLILESAKAEAEGLRTRAAEDRGAEARSMVEFILTGARA